MDIGVYFRNFHSSADCRKIHKSSALHSLIPRNYYALDHFVRSTIKHACNPQLKNLYPVYTAGKEALDYFQKNNPGAEKMGEGSNEAEWIVNLTTHADRDNKCAPLNSKYLTFTMPVYDTICVCLCLVGVKLHFSTSH